MKVFIQNQVGHKPRRWDRTGVVMECKDFDQYVIKVDGTGRLTLRNRKFLRQLMPIKKQAMPTRTQVLKPIIPPAMPTITPANPDTLDRAAVAFPLAHGGDRDDARDQDHVPQQGFYHTPATRSITPPHLRSTPIPVPGTAHTIQDPVSYQAVPTPSAPPTPTRPGTPQSPIQSPRPQRNRKPNVRYNEAEWDLGTLVEDSPTLSSKQVMDLLNFLATRLGKKTESQP